MNLTKAESVDVFLSEAARERLGDLINSLAVCDIMKSEALQEDKFDQFLRWRIAEQRATVELFDEFGVELPGLENAQRCLNKNDS